MIVVSPGVVLSPIFPGITADHPIIGWRSIVAASTLVADTASADFPAANLFNPATHLRWKAADATVQYLTVSPSNADDIDYVGIARHNLSSKNIPVSIEVDTGSGFTEAVAPQMLASDGPIIFRFTRQAYNAVRVKFGAGDAPADIAVLYVGALLVMPQKLYQGFTPLPQGRKQNEVNAVSQVGNYLGTIVTQRRRESKVPFTLIDPDYCRAHIDPFLAARTPFFFGWRPQTYPNESGYAWLTNFPEPAPQSPHSLIGFSLEMTGIV